MADTNWSINVDAAGIYQLPTKDKYVDRDINITVPKGDTSVTGMATNILDTGHKIHVSAGFQDLASDTYIDNATLTASVSGLTTTGSSTSVGSYNSTNKNYPLTTNLTVTGNAVATVSSEGYATSDENKTTSIGSVSKSVSTTVPAGELTVSGTASATVTSVTVGAKSGNTYSVTGSATATNTNGASATVSTAGYVTTSQNKNGNISTTANVNATIPAGVFSNTASSGITYTKDSSAATAIPSEGSLYINAGWYPNTQIELKHLLVDDTTKDNAAVEHIRYGYEAVDPATGKTIVGTMPEAVATVAAPTATSESVTMSKGSGSITSIVSSAPTSTQPSSGNYLVLKPKYTATLTNGSPSVTTNGYLGAASDITASNGSASKEVTMYVPITNAATPSLSITDKTTTITPTATSGSSSTYDITASLSGKTTYGTAGYISTSGLSAATDSSVTVGRIPAGVITNNTSGGTADGTINAGSQIKISKGWYPNDLYYTAQSASSTGSADVTATVAKTITSTKAVFTPSYIVNTAGYIAAGGTGTALEVDLYTGTYSFIAATGAGGGGSAK